MGKSDNTTSLQTPLTDIELQPQRVYQGKWTGTRAD